MSLKVLLIDDHMLFREGLISLLQRRNIEVLAAVGDGNEGIRLAVEVGDNGTGFDPDNPQSHERHGIRNMRDRARAVGAVLSINGSAGEGTTVRAEVTVGSSEV